MCVCVCYGFRFSSACFDLSFAEVAVVNERLDKRSKRKTDLSNAAISVSAILLLFQNRKGCVFAQTRIVFRSREKRQNWHRPLVCFIFRLAFACARLLTGSQRKWGENPKTDCKFSAVPVFLFSLIIFAYARKFFSAMHSLSLR